MINKTFPRSEESFLQGYPLLAVDISDFNFPAKCQQPDTAITRRHRMRNVSGQGGNVADLWTTDNTTTFHEAGAGADNRFIFHYLCVGNCTTDDDVVTLPGHLVESINAGSIHHRFDRRGTALLYIQQKVCTPADNTGMTVVLIKQSDGL